MISESYLFRIFDMSPAQPLESGSEDFVENMLTNTSSYILSSASGAKSDFQVDLTVVRPSAAVSRDGLMESL